MNNQTANNNHYDLIVIGAGSGGVRAARIAANYGAEVRDSNTKIDFLSNGFKLRCTFAALNGSDDYAYAAFAENPFISSKGVPATAR